VVEARYIETRTIIALYIVEAIPPDLAKGQRGFDMAAVMTAAETGMPNWE